MSDENIITKEQFDAQVTRAQRFEAQLADAQKRLESFKDIDPEAYKAMKEDYDSMRKSSAGNDPKKIDEIVTSKVGEVERRFSNKITELEKRATSAEAKNKRLEVVVPAMSEAAKLINSDALDLVQSLIERDLDFVDGQIIVKNADGTPKASEVDPRVTRMPLSEYLQNITNKYPSIAKPTVKTGTEKPGVNTTSTNKANVVVKPPTGFENWSQREQEKWFAANPEGGKAYMRQRFG